jgi:lysophospholipase L1-like esterase
MTIKTGVLLLLTTAYVALGAGQKQWIVTWGASPAPQLADEAKRRSEKLEYKNQTIREIVHTSSASSMVRVRLSNAYGKETVKIGAAHIALRDHGAAIVPGTDRALTFSGMSSISIPPNALVLSDPVELKVPAASDLAVSIFLPEAATGAGIHYSAQETAYIGAGDLTGSPTIDNAETMESWVFLTGVDALADGGGATVVAFGDSITDGAHSTVDANHRWPNFLADRLQSAHRTDLGVLDAGIGGNRIWNDAATNVAFGVSGLARFDRDVLAQPGVKYVIVLEGINDLGHPGSSAPASEKVTAQDLIAGSKQMIARAHEKGIKIFGATLTPFAGTVFPGYYTQEKDTQRKAFNEWIRTSKSFDGVIDFDKAVQDPGNPDHMLPAYDSGDHLHPNDAGYKAMGDAIPLSLFR